MAIRTNRNAPPRPADDYYLGCIQKIAAAFSVELSEATQAVYLERLRKLSGEQIQTATSRTIEEWGKASQMPPLAFILERGTPYQELPHYEMPSFKQLADHSKVTKQEIAEWLEGGKESQREHIAKLYEDPQWCALAERLIQRDFKPKPTQVPSDPEERARWAKQTAEKGGWL